MHDFTGGMNRSSYLCTVFLYLKKGIGVERNWGEKKRQNACPFDDACWLTEAMIDEFVN